MQTTDTIQRIPKMFKLKGTSAISAIFIVCFGSSYATGPIFFNLIGTAVVPRMEASDTNGFYTELTDNTTFTLDREIFVTQVDLPQLLTIRYDGKFFPLTHELKTVVNDWVVHSVFLLQLV